jgi:hypothetical protein
MSSVIVENLRGAGRSRDRTAMELLGFGESLLIVERDAEKAYSPRIAGVDFQFGSKGLFGRLKIASLHGGRRGLDGCVLLRAPAR